MDKNKIIDQIIILEWKMLISVMALDDPDGCRENPETFEKMRRSQHLIWSEDTLASYLKDLQYAEENGINLIAERYAHMMEFTNPQEFILVEGDLTPIDPKANMKIKEIVEIFDDWNDELDARYKYIRATGRPKSENDGWTSVATYLEGELKTYSYQTLLRCKKDVENAKAHGINLGEKILENTARFYGFASLLEMEIYLKDYSYKQIK